MKTFMKLYAKEISGAISGWDRIRFRGTIRWLASVSGLNSYLGVRGILLKEFGDFAESVTAKVRAICTSRAKELGIPKLYLRSASVDKEALARQIMQERGVTTGDICMLSVIEPCMAPAIVRDRSTKMIDLVMIQRKCAWIYHYWNDEQLGFGHTRLQTWFPLTATVCLNGRHWLERQFIREGVGYVKDGNCFVQIDDYAKAAELIEEQQRTNWPELLDGLLARQCPGLEWVPGGMPMNHYWSANETEWATDIVFRRSADLDRLFPKFIRHGMITAQSPDVMRFLGRKGGGPKPNEVRSDVRHRHEGVRIKHSINRNSVKMYNKAGNVLRTETTINQPREFKVYRHPDDDLARPASWQKMRKGVADLHRRAEVSQASNERYLEHMAAAQADDSLIKIVEPICKRIRKKGKTHRAIHPWGAGDFQTLQFLARGEMQLNGFTNRDLREALYGNSTDPAEQKRRSNQISRRLRLLRAHGLIRKIPRSNRYQLTLKGRKISCAVLAASAANTEQLMEMTA